MTAAASVELVFIVGQYKCGTTWLLNALSAHPDVVGVAEVDLIRSAYNFATDGSSQPATREERLYRFFDGSGWCAYHDATGWHGRDTVVNMEQGLPPEVKPGDLSRPQRFQNLSPAVQRSLYERIANAQRPEAAMDAFVGALSSNRSSASHLVLKAADQIPVINSLDKWQPHARKVVITRDGRDASISAQHFIEFTRSLDAPYKGERLTFGSLLTNWAARATRAVQLAEEGRVYLLRYEDLLYDFDRTIIALLQWLDLGASTDTVKALRTTASFEATAGRKQGIEAEHFFRKGVAGEWMRRLSFGERVEAWTIAGEALRALGYTWNGWLGRLPAARGQRHAEMADGAWEDKQASAQKDLALQFISPTSRVLVASNLAEEPRNLISIDTSEFLPQNEESERAYAAQDGQEALALVQRGQRNGAEFMIIPPTQLRWLESCMPLRAYLNEHAVRIFGHDELGALYELKPWPLPTEIFHIGMNDYGNVDGELTFRCNICGSWERVLIARLRRDVVSCRSCGSTPRWRAVISALSRELFGESLVIADFPVRRDLNGVGMTDWVGYATRLCEKFAYENTFLDDEPRLDIASLKSRWEGTQDFVLTSDVFEHVKPPVSAAFENLRCLLKPGGVAIFTAPYGPGAETVEHYPNLFEYEIVKRGEEFEVRNIRRDGETEVFPDPIFHGGPGQTLEMRQFCEADILEHMASAGFAEMHVCREPDFAHGVYWPEPYSLPIVARAPRRVRDASRRAAPRASPPKGALKWQALLNSARDELRAGADLDVAGEFVGLLLAQSLEEGSFPRLFTLWERLGVHVTPVQFYFPIPDTRRLDDRFWSFRSDLPGIDMNESGQLELLREVFSGLAEECETVVGKVERAGTGGGRMFGGTDARALYCMIRHCRPRRIVEVGSGESTRIAAAAGSKNGGTRLVAIEPFPNEELRRGFTGLDALIERRVQDVDQDVFDELAANDILFIDSSHVVTVGSDVVHLFLEVLPRLQPGVIVHVHDIYFPFPYRREWVMEEMRFWNEQYLLQAFLTLNREVEVLLANSFLHERHPGVFREVFPNAPWWGGGSFWFRRKTGGGQV